MNRLLFLICFLLYFIWQQPLSAKPNISIAVLDSLASALQESEPLKSLEYAKQMLDAAQRSKQTDKLSRAYQRQGEVLQVLGIFDEAIKAFYQSIELIPKAGSEALQGDVLYLLGLSYFSLGDYQKSYEFHDKSKKAYVIAKRHEDTLKSQSEIGLALLALGKEEEVTGSGSIDVLGGLIDQLSTQISGSGAIEMSNVKTNITETETTGSGETRVHVINKLDVSITGSGDVFYRGKPQIKNDITGSGELKPLE